jgi:hypothetical protein
MEGDRGVGEGTGVDGLRGSRGVVEGRLLA